MINNGRLIELALGAEAARKCDTAIPQHIANTMTQTQREETAGWYYDDTNPYFGRRLTHEECWKEIMHKLRNGKLRATLFEQDITIVVVDWPCLRFHVLRGEIVLTEA